MTKTPKDKLPTTIEVLLRGFEATIALYYQQFHWNRDANKLAEDTENLIKKTQEAFARIIEAEGRKDRIDEIRNFAGYEDDDWEGMAYIPQQRFIERIKELEEKNR